MEKKSLFTRILAVTGTVLSWLPILAPILFSLLALISAGIFRFDYLMPAELFPFALLGGGLLLWAALRARLYRGLIGTGLSVAIGSLVGGQLLAVFTGLASGATEPGGGWFAIVIASIVVYSLALVLLAVGGLRLTIDLFGKPRPTTESRQA